MQLREAKTIYRLLEQETATLAEYKNETIEIYQAIKKKEFKFTNVFNDKYHKIEHKSELYQMRADIIKKCEEYRKKKGENLIWRGVPYLEICKHEKIDIETKMKD